MNTITIHSEKPDDIYFIRELVNRLGLQSEIKEDENYMGIGRMQPTVDYETPEGIVASVKRGLQYVEERKAGLHKEKTLLELIDEED